MTITTGTTFTYNDLLWEVNAELDGDIWQAEVIDSPDDDDLGKCQLFESAVIRVGMTGEWNTWTPDEVHPDDGLPAMRIRSVEGPWR